MKCKALNIPSRQRLACSTLYAFAGFVLLLSMHVAGALGADRPRPAKATTYYVSPRGDDTAAGTAKAPWRTLQRAVKAVKPGDRVVARPGSYAGFVLGWDSPQGGTPAAPIVYEGEPGATIVSRNNKTPDGIDLEPGCGYVSILGFTIDNADGTIRRAGIRISGSDHVTVLKNTCENNGTWGIFASHSNDLRVEGNTTSGSKAEHGIYVSNSMERAVIRGNTVFDNAMCGIHLNGDASQGGHGLIASALIERNVIHGNGRRGGSAINGDGLQSSVIRSNLLYDNHSSGISLYKVDGAQGSKGNVVVNNTIVMAPDARWGLNIKGGSTANTVCNNILLNANRSRGSISVASDSRSGFVSDYNVVEDRFSAAEERVETLAAWRSGTGQDRHSRIATRGSLFADVAAHDYHLSPRSPALGAGSVAISTRQVPRVDLDGQPIRNPPAAGAYQSGPGQQAHADARR